MLAKAVGNHLCFIDSHNRDILYVSQTSESVLATDFESSYVGSSPNKGIIFLAQLVERVLQNPT